MDRIAQEAQARQRMLKYLEKHGAIDTADRCHASRKTVWKWNRRYDGTLESLKERSSRPKHSPRKQSEEELTLVYTAKDECSRWTYRQLYDEHIYQCFDFQQLQPDQFV